jgi:putative phosphoesterase
MRVVVLADTHMPRRAKSLPPQLEEALESAALAIHLGDFTENSVAEMIESRCKLVAVHGNNDSTEVCLRFPATITLQLEAFHLILLRGHVGGPTALDAARRTVGGAAVLFGHSHRAYCAWEKGRLLFNPGSPTDRRWAPLRTFGILDVDATLEPALITVRQGL